ncbi:MAG: 30S ribosomal protein S13 [Candidatus Woesearchaeota archaeon]|jgi:small subunit ribosomal protein S13|nr:30S ribosomal protein S13 [Candidatus Woesearchaeota archaeon]
MAEQEIKHLVRISNTDLAGKLPASKALTKIKGVSFMFANMICSLTKTDKLKMIGIMGDEEIKKLESAIESPSKFNAPEWMLNRRKDVEDGISKHLITGNLDFVKDNDIKIMRKIKSYKGSRHAAGLPARGQRTKSNFRKNKGKVSLGVKKRSGAKAGRP